MRHCLNVSSRDVSLADSNLQLNISVDDNALRKSVFSSDISFDLMDLGLFGFDPTSSKQIYWYCNGIETEGPLVRRS